MKRLFFLSLLFSFFLTLSAFAQSNFSSDAYYQYLLENKNLSFEELQSKFSAENTYYKGFDKETQLDGFSYLDSIQIKYGLTDQETELLKLNRFVVTERLDFDCFGKAFHDIYIKDLPVFISTDAILHALHASYDQILVDLEIAILEPNLADFLDNLYAVYPQLISKYADYDTLQNALKDVGLYVTIAKSLLIGEKQQPQLTSQQQIDEMWSAIQNEQLSSLPLFSERQRKLDFSQFTVRGHYNNDNLRDYFKAMMWLGRMDFLLTSPPENPWEQPWTREEIRRMNLGAFILNELIELSNARSKMEQNDHIITFMVGESDNITPAELSAVINAQNLTSADQLLDNLTYDAYYEAIKESNGAEQKILSQFMMMDPWAEEPGELPVSFRLMGQRFIVDSYIFFNVVFDRIVYQDKLIWRPMPDPLDALFVLGNEDALPLLKKEIETYHYSSQLAALRYLVESYDPEFWQASLYNVWLEAIRKLNPAESRDGFPLFMKTAAWRQNKINTQLASWSQLRHDNLLYAKQSYTGGSGCSFPHSFVEPIPEFYAQIAAFAETAQNYFNQFKSDTYEMYLIKEYFPGLKEVMNNLEQIALKEVAGQLLDTEDIKWLKEMLFEDGVSGAPPFSGWYAYLYYHPDDAAFSDYIIADVHTQPTDFVGNHVGRVLHVGTAKINLGIFLTEASSSANQPLAYIGPVMSYYEKITKDFDRLTDERWTEMVETNDLPLRPDWVNIYLTDSNGKKFDQGRELPSVIYTGGLDKPQLALNSFKLDQNYPNPFNPSTTISYSLKGPLSGKLSAVSDVKLTIYNTLGQKVLTLVDTKQSPGIYSVKFNSSHLPSGIYFYHIRAGIFTATKKMMVMR